MKIRVRAIALAGWGSERHSQGLGRAVDMTV